MTLFCFVSASSVMVGEKEKSYWMGAGEGGFAFHRNVLFLLGGEGFRMEKRVGDSQASTCSFRMQPVFRHTSACLPASST